MACSNWVAEERLVKELFAGVQTGLGMIQSGRLATSGSLLCPQT